MLSILILGFAIGLTPTIQGEQDACKNVLFEVPRSNVTVVSSKVVSPERGGDYCRVVGTILPDVGFEVELPLPSDWNGRFYMVDNAGSGGRINSRRMAGARRLGYATASTDQGYDYQTEGDSRYGYNNRQKEIDFGFRSVHVTAEAAKDIIEVFYARPAAFSYFVGGSAGGRQALMEAQRFPDDFDGILLSAPTLNISKIQMWGLWKAKALSGSGYISPELVPTLASAVYDRCDAIDGVEDGVIDDPRACDFDPDKHLTQCDSGNATNCFTAAQVTALKKIYGGVRNSKGELLFPGQSPGAEAKGDQPPWIAANGPESAWLDWVVYTKGETPRYLDLAHAFMKYTAFDTDDADYDWTQFDFDVDPSRMDEMAAIVDAVDPDLSAFRASGGKMIHYHHWADTAVPPINSINYYDSVVKTMGPVDDFYKFYLVPGGFHGAPGVGATNVPWLDTLVSWVENGDAPSELTAERVENREVVRTRKICPHPMVGTYSGSGPTDSVESFVCVPRPTTTQTPLPPDSSAAAEALDNSVLGGKWVQVARANQSPLRTWVVHPQGAGAAPAVILIHGNRGLNDWFRAAADRVAAAGFIALAPDLLSGKGPGGGGVDSLTQEDVRRLMGTLTTAEVDRAIDVVWAHAPSLEGWNGKSATMGICWGGGVSFRFATRTPELAAAVVFYGESPDTSTLSSVRAPVLGLYGGDDARINETIPEAAAEMARLGRVYEREVYDGAGHAFLQRQTENDGSNRNATENGWPRAIQFLRQYLEP